MSNSFCLCFHLIGRSKIMSSRNLEMLYIYGLLALGKNFGTTSEMEQSPQNIAFHSNNICDKCSAYITCYHQPHHHLKWLQQGHMKEVWSSLHVRFTLHIVPKKFNCQKIQPFLALSKIMPIGWVDLNFKMKFVCCHWSWS